MVESLGQLWEKIDSWLLASAPVSRQAIVPPAPAARVAALLDETAVGVPDELSQWWALHDGARNLHDGAVLPGRFAPIGIESMAAARSRGIEIGEAVWPAEVRSMGEGGPAGSHAWAFPKSFVPIAEDTSGDVLAVDLRDGDARGCLKVYDHEEGALLPPVASSLAALLADVAYALANETSAIGWFPIAEDGRLNWQPRQGA